jgi:hypothetical protein
MKLVEIEKEVGPVCKKESLIEISRILRGLFLRISPSLRSKAVVD